MSNITQFPIVAKLADEFDASSYPPPSDAVLTLQGSTEGTRKLPFGSLYSDLLTRTNSRRSAQAWVFDGTASGIFDGYAPGTGDVTLAVLYAPDSLAATTYPLYSSGLNALGIQVNTNGTIAARQNGVGALASSTGSINAGKASWLVYTRSGATGTYYIEGSPSGTVTDSRNYSTATNQINGPGKIERAIIVNAALSAAEVAALAETGRLPSWCHSAQVGQPAGVGLITGDNSTFASDTGFWGKTSATISAGTCTISAGGNILARTASASNFLGRSLKYRCALNIVTNGGLGISDGATSLGTFTGTGDQIVEFTVPANSSLARFYISSSGSSEVSTVTLTPLGSVLNLDPDQPGSGNVWSNTNGTGDAIAPASGVTWAVPGTGSTRLRTTTATNGNQQLYGTSIFPTTSQILRVRAKASTGTPTVTLGNASGGSQIVSSVALTTAWKNLAIVSGGEITSTANLWAGSNSTDVVYWDIEVQTLN